MTEDNPFAEFQTSDAPADKSAKPAKAKRKRAPKKKAAPAPRAVTDADIKQAVEKKVRKRAAKVARSIKLDIGAILPAIAGLKEDDAKLLMQIVQVLQASNKKSRSRIVAALGRIFA